ncbi:MAG: acyl carrier protein [Elusimicrobia bacterium]|nr:acyl carrier protein [Elusimicrobiota bacterium]
MMRARLKEIMAGVFQTAAADIPDDARLGSVPGWDSLGHITLMMAIEAEWNVSLTADAMQNALTLPAVEDFIADALKAKGPKDRP